MKIVRHLSFKETLWNIFNKLTNSYSNLTVNDLGNGSIKCFWEISSIDSFRIELSKSCFSAIRVFDISNNRDINNSTCIMKEIQVNKFQSSITFPIPVNKGMYYFEFGYRKKNGNWRRLAYQHINLGFRIKKIIRSFDNDSWFDSNTRIRGDQISFHEKAYQLSLKSPIGGSEIIADNEKNI